MRTVELSSGFDGSLSLVKPTQVDCGRAAKDIPDDAILRLKCRGKVESGAFDALSPDSIQSVYLLHKEADDDQVVEVARAFPDLMELHIPRAHRVTDMACEAIATLTNLRSLNLYWARITDDGAEHLARLGSLRRLTLMNGTITDGGFGRLGGLRDLRLVQVDGNRGILGTGLAGFAGHERLVYLFMPGTKVGDEQIAHLSGCRSLMRINLSSTNVTEQCVLSLPCNEACEVFLPSGVDGAKVDEVRRLRPELIIDGVRGADMRPLPTARDAERSDLPLPLRSNSPTLALFTADWCGPCGWVKREIDLLPPQLREQFRFVEIDVEADPGTAQAMRVQSLPTLMFLADGREHARLIGAHKATAIAERMRSLLR